MKGLLGGKGAGGRTRNSPERVRPLANQEHRQGRPTRRVPEPGQSVMPPAAPSAHVGQGVDGRHNLENHAGALSDGRDLVAPVNSRGVVRIRGNDVDAVGRPRMCPA